MRSIPVLLIVISLFMFPSTSLAAPGAERPTELAGEGPWVVRAYEWTEETVRELGTEFEHIGVYREKGMLILHLDNRRDLDRVLALGLRIELDEAQTAVLRRLEDALRAGESGISGIPGFECYRTVEQTMADAEALVATYPDLASYIDIGDSWEKTQPGGLEGYDLRVLKLTNANIGGDKPAALFVGSTHAREYTTAELVTRFGEWMLSQYGLDPDVTWVIDHHELHLLLYANPDGRKKAETGLSWRKNTDSDDGCQDSTSWGVDLNRNWDFQWGCCGGSSTSSCSITYRGPSAASEPEIQALQTYIASIFPDQREPNDLVTPADPNAEGLFIDFHSFGRIVLVPWSFFPGGCSGAQASTCAPDWTGLLTLARKYSFFPGYNAFLGSTGTVDGASKDYSYGILGVPGYTVELGTSFFENCANFENTIYPNNLPAMLQVAKSIRRSYIEPSGPDILDAVAVGSPFVAGDQILLTATADDTRFSPPDPDDPVLDPTQNIVSADVYVNTPWWDGGTPVTMAAVDGTFDESVENIQVSLDTTGWSEGRHTLFIRATDASGAFGATGAAFAYVIDPATAPTLQGTVFDAESGGPVEAEISVGVFNAMSSPATGAFSLQVPPGTYDIQVAAEGYATESLEDLELASLQVATRNFALAPILAIIVDDVESGNQGWTADAPWAITTEEANSPTHSWTDSPGSEYGDNLDISLTSPVFDLSERRGTVLSFRHLHDFEATWDFGFVEASPDGVTWSTVATYSVAGQNTIWQEVEIPLPMLDGAAAAQFRFRITSDTNTTEDGWHIDDINLRAARDSTIFMDGFEAGNLTAWSGSAP